MTDYRMKDDFEKHSNSSELSVENPCEVSDSYDMFLNNISIPVVARKLDFTNLDDDEGTGETPQAPPSFSPPYKRVRALKLFDSPYTPKSLLHKCSTPTHPSPRSRIHPPKFNVPTGMPSGSSHHLHPPSTLLHAPALCAHSPSDEDSGMGSLPPDELDHTRSARRPLANINPFTPDGPALKRALSKTPQNDRIRESNISRYNVEFVELDVIGRGHFGIVTRCVNKLDGCVYALKRSLRPVAGSAAERAALNEVQAHAALGKHPHLVTYYSAWKEDNHMIIQSEYCDGGSLQQKIEKEPLPESELLFLLAHVAAGLAYIHSRELVHLDLKPGNIFVCRDDVSAARDSDDSGDDDDAHHAQPPHKYKIGDLGHVTSTCSPSVEEGDCRYLPKEVLQEDYTHLTKADIFAFGLTLYEAGGGGPLPMNGQEWHDMRDGKLPDLPNLSREFNQLLKKMVDPDPTQRPSAARLRRHPLLHPGGNKSKAQLRRELKVARMENEFLAKKLQEASKCIKSLTPRGLVQESSKYLTRSAKRLQSATKPARSTRQKVDPDADNNNKKFLTSLGKKQKKISSYLKRGEKMTE